MKKKNGFKQHEIEMLEEEDGVTENLDFDELTEIQGGVDEENYDDCGLGCFKGQIRED